MCLIAYQFIFCNDQGDFCFNKNITLFPVVTSNFSILTFVRAFERVAVITEQTVTPTIIQTTANDLAREDFGALSPYLYRQI